MTKVVVQATKRGRGVSPIYLNEDDQPEMVNVIYMCGCCCRCIVFGWYGGKFSYLDWLLFLFLKCYYYCEPFAGSGAVLINAQLREVGSNVGLALFLRGEKHMVVNKKQIQELNSAALPLMKWLAENCHPHCTAIVDSERCEVLEGFANTLKREHVIACPSNPL